MKSIQVIRTASSSYHQPDFFNEEKQKLESLTGIKYSESLESVSDLDTILISNTHTRLSAIDPKILERTKLIVHSNSGYDHFISEQKFWKNIPVIIGHEIRAQAVAEYTLAALFNAFINIPFVVSWDKNRNWSRGLINTKKIGIYGHGHIGKILDKTLTSLGAKVSIHDPFKNKSHTIPLEEMDAVLFCCGLNSTSKHLGNEQFFQQLKPDVVIINGARGGLISSEALKSFLKKNKASQVYLDVFEQEPFDDNWNEYSQIKKSSHVAGVFRELDNKIIDFEYDTIKDFINLAHNDFLTKYHSSLLENKIHDGEII